MYKRRVKYNLHFLRELFTLSLVAQSNAKVMRYDSSLYAYKRSSNSLAVKVQIKSIFAQGGMK